jgi:PAS domain S-box-containing protein
LYRFKLGTLFIGALTTTILLAVITGYLLSRRNKARDAWYLTGYLMVIFLLTLSYTLRYAFFSPFTLNTGQLSNFIVFGIVCLIQFAYHFGKNPYPRESKVVLILSLTSSVMVWGSLFFKKDLLAIYDFQNQYFSYSYGPSVSLLTLFGFIWAFIVFLRKSLSGSGGTWASSNRNFAFLTLFTTVLPLFYLLFQFDIITRNVYNLIFNTGSLLVCIAIFTVYVNNSPQPTSFMIKIVGIPLVVVLSAFGIISNTLMPVIHKTIADRYYDQIELVQSSLIKFDEKSLPSTVAFILPPEGLSGEFFFLDDSIPDEYAQSLISTSRSEGLFPERAEGKAEFFYIDLMDVQSFFISFRMIKDERVYEIGFPYEDFCDSLHSFVFRIMVIVIITTIAVLIGFPLVFKLGLLKPLERLLEGVDQVSSGHYKVKLTVHNEDELGQLARGFNSMVLSLRNAEGNFKALTENANDAILILSSDCNILFANQKSSDISGYPVGKLLGMHFTRLIYPDDQPAVTNRLYNEMHGKDGFLSYETRLLHSKEHIVPVEISGAPTIWQDNPADVVVIRDISERKWAEEALQAQQQQLMKMDKMASLGALVAGMAHEINNPNQAIGMNLHFLENGLSSLFTLIESGEEADDSVEMGGMGYDEFKSCAQSTLDEIGGSTRRIDHIVKELKRLVRGGESLDFKSIDINQVIQIVSDLSRHMIRQSTKHFELKLEEELPYVLADQIGLEQVVLNLLQNACQSLKNRNEAIKIQTYTDKSALMVCLKIQDEGVGIKAEDLEHITDSFFTTRSAMGGTGLGLSISARIICEHQGNISFDSSPGKGTTVLVSIPMNPHQHLSS